MSYNTRVVNFYNATGSLAHFENKYIFLPYEKRSSLLQRCRCSCKFKNRRIGSWIQSYDFGINNYNAIDVGWSVFSKQKKIFLVLKSTRLLNFYNVGVVTSVCKIGS
jgi:hypothetical protein